MKKSAPNLKFVFSMLVFVIACGVEPAQANLTPYTGEPPNSISSLSATDRQKLERNDPVKLNVTSDGGTVVFRVNASPATVWGVIRDFGQYPNRVPYVKSTTVTTVGEHVDVDFVVGNWMADVRYSIDHYFPAGKMWVTWTLNKAKPSSQVTDTIGYWRVDPVPGNPDKSNVTYSIATVLTSLGRFARGLLGSDELLTATQWLRQASET